MASVFQVAGLRGLSFLPCLIVLGVIAFFYYMYMDSYLLPMMKKANSIPFPISELTDLSQIIWNRPTIYCIITHSLIFMFIVSYLKVVFTSPGTIPDEWNKRMMEEVIEEYIRSKKENNSGLFANLLTKEMMSNINVYDKDFKEFLKNSGRRYCDTCKKLKPDRAHHCSQCGVCILKMDHHCNWMYNCIGYYNYKAFLVFLLYTNILLIFFFITYLECLAHFYLDPKVSDLRFFLISLAFFLNASFCMILFSFTCFHVFYLASENRTTLEFCERSTKNEDFDQGWWTNWSNICGPNPIFWLFPFCTRNEGDGVKFKQKYESDDEMFDLIRK